MSTSLSENYKSGHCRCIKQVTQSKILGCMSGVWTTHLKLLHFCKIDSGLQDSLTTQWVFWEVHAFAVLFQTFQQCVRPRACSQEFLGWEFCESSMFSPFPLTMNKGPIADSSEEILLEEESMSMVISNWNGKNIWDLVQCSSILYGPSHGTHGLQASSLQLFCHRRFSYWRT